MLFTGIAWRHLPQEMGCSPATAHRRLAEWQAAGVWDRLHRELLRGLNAAGRVDWSTSVVDGSHIRVLLGGSTPGPRRLIARRSTEHGSGLGKERWVVERTFAWLHNLRRLIIRYERSAELHLAFMLLGCAVVRQRSLSAA